ncbi:hypothetical protein F0U61_18375 [Archangium violaceum]|uniref:hypothetical protein n=1 Tax=Archangium violaceum TaxID=83451 RepID=UPI002B2EDCAA|nr:hypothetical protein F0U61_18375 [Archangium violaceum]
MERSPESRGTTREGTGRVLAKGITYGLIAGLIFAVVKIIGSVSMGNPAWMPVRMFSSVLLGREAFSDVVWRGWFTALGLGVHFGLSALLGLIYAVIESQMSVEGRTSWGRQSAVGLLFGAAVWLVNYQIIARLFYPWFLETPQFLQLALHAVVFGWPLGLMFAATERHQQKRKTRRPVGKAVQV